MQPSLDELKELLVQQTAVGDEALHQRRLAGDAGSALCRGRRHRGGGDHLVSLVKAQPPQFRSAMMFPEMWQRWLDKLDSKGFFDGADPCSEERRRRVALAADRFDVLAKRRSRNAEASVANNVLQQPLGAKGVTRRSQQQQPSLYSLIDVD